MGKRSSFERVERDYYPTPYEAVVPLLKHLPKSYTFTEPCAGDGRLIDHLVSVGGVCEFASDIEPQRGDIQTLNCFNVDVSTDYCITNPPWNRKILHPMIEYFASQCPTWFLFDSDWAYTKQSIEYMTYCKKIVAIGRVKWIEDSKTTGKENACWYLFHKDGVEETTQFFGRAE